ncbi:MAG: hypothetical protein IJW70_03025 [Clostridia bacterium]|nr:hypothetical protein [Clostridia bacterium]
MNQNNDQQEFIYTYSAKDKDEISRIRKKYEVNAKDHKLKRLHDLDASVQGYASSASIAIGTIGTLIMGTGMSAVMVEEFGTYLNLGIYTTPIGIAVGIAGLAIAICAYPVYRAVSEKRKKQIAPEILSLIEELEKEDV